MSVRPAGERARTATALLSGGLDSTVAVALWLEAGGSVARVVVSENIEVAFPHFKRHFLRAVLVHSNSGPRGYGG